MMMFRWRDLDLPVVDVPEVQRRARVAEHPLIDGETLQVRAGHEARTLAIRVVLSGPWRDMVPGLDKATDPGTEGVLEHPSEGRLRAFVRSCVAIRHSDGSVDYRLEWAVVGPADPPAAPSSPARTDALGGFRDASARWAERMVAAMSPAEILAAIQAAQEVVGIIRSYASSLYPGATGAAAIATAIGALEGSVASLGNDPVRLLRAWSDTLALLPPAATTGLYRQIPPPPSTQKAQMAVWALLASEAAIAVAEAALATGETEAATGPLDAAVVRATDPEAYLALSRYRSLWRADVARMGAGVAYDVEPGESVLLFAARIGADPSAVLAALNPPDPCWLQGGSYAP